MELANEWLETIDNCIQLEKPHWFCKTHNAGPFNVTESSKCSGNILELHQKQDCDIQYLAKEKAMQMSQGVTFLS